MFRALIPVAILLGAVFSTSAATQTQHDKSFWRMILKQHAARWQKKIAPLSDSVHLNFTDGQESPFQSDKLS